VGERREPVILAGEVRKKIELFKRMKKKI